MFLSSELLSLLFYCTDPDDPLKTTDQTRRLGLIVRFLIAVTFLLPLILLSIVIIIIIIINYFRKFWVFCFIFIGLLQVCRGTAVMLVSPTEGTDEIANPFIQPDGA